MRGMEPHRLSPSAYPLALPLVPEEPPALLARAALLAGREGVSVSVNDAASPALVAVEWKAEGRRVRAVAGAADHPALPSFLTGNGPLTVYALAGLAARIPVLRPDLRPVPMATFAPPEGTDAAFRALPPGGVRRLRPADARHLASFPAWLWGAGGTPEIALREGAVYARYLRAEIVSVAVAAARTERYDLLTAYTIERARRNGFARECAARLIGAIGTERGTRPLWACAVDDAPAIAVARSLGFVEWQAWAAFALP